jgi:hypothetical protein
MIDRLFRRKKVVQEATGSKINKTNYKDFLVKAIGFVSSATGRSGDFETPENDLSEIKMAYGSDSYIKMAHMKYAYLLFKAGYELKGKNDSAVEYLKIRFRMMSFSTQKPIDILFQEIGDDMLLFSNAFLAKTRVKKPMAGIKAQGVYADQPIGGYFRLDPTTVTIKRDKNGTVVKYQQQTSDGNTKDFNPTEIIHLYMDKDGSNAFGTPRFVAALEDVKMLRRIEGNIITLIYRFSMPLYQWIIGKPEKGFEATDPEIEAAKKEIESMTLDGSIVTNEKTEIKAIGAEGEALDASAYLSYFEKRVFSALGVSETQMGRGSAKGNADSMEEQTHDTVKYVQRVMSIFFRELLLSELLLEGGYNPIANPDDIVEYAFNEINIETKVKVENAEVYKFQSNVVTFEEMRRNLGMDADDVDEARLYANMIESKVAIEQIEAQGAQTMEAAKLGASIKGAASSSSSGSTKSTKPDGTVTSTQRPTNQHGTTTAKIKESFEIQEALKKSEFRSKKSFASVYKKYENTCNDIAEAKSDRDIVLMLGADGIIRDLLTEVHSYAMKGITDARFDIHKLDDNLHGENINVSTSLFEEEVKDTVQNLLKDIKERIAKTEDKAEIKAVFNAMAYRLRYLINYVLPKAYWYHYVKTGAAYGINKAYIDFGGSSDEKTHKPTIDPSDFGMDDIPAFHAFCDCKVLFRKVGDSK